MGFFELFNPFPSAKPVRNSEFRAYVNDYFAPKLYENGWQGRSGHYRKFVGNYVHVLGFQPSVHSEERKTEVGIGVHFSLLNPLTDAKVELNNIQYYQCFFQKKLEYKGDFWWKYGSNESENVAIIEKIYSIFDSEGKKFFSDFQNYPQPFQSQTPDTALLLLESIKEKHSLTKIGSNINFIYMLCQLNDHLENYDLMKEFANSALEGKFGSILGWEERFSIFV